MKAGPTQTSLATNPSRWSRVTSGSEVALVGGLLMWLKKKKIFFKGVFLLLKQVANLVFSQFS